MAPERTTRINRPEEEPEHQHPETGAASASETEEPRPAGFGARLRQLVAQSRQGASHPNIQRQQLKQDRTKSFLMLAGSMVVMAFPPASPTGVWQEWARLPSTRTVQAPQ